MDQHSQWKESNGDDTYALDWDIHHHAVVWEIGGFEGRWAMQIAQKFDPYLYIFEPQTWAVERMQLKFAKRDKVTINPYGLWVMDAKLPLYNVETDGASLVNPSVRSQVYEFKDVYDELQMEVDLCLMNIEGSEFILLPYMIANGLMKNIRYFWCQFHPGLVSMGDERYLRISDGIRKTHTLKWNFYPTAVAWERK